MGIIPEKMQAPEGVATASILGHNYEVGSNGQIKVAVQEHVAVLRQHGFTDAVESSETAADILKMDDENLREYIEERGGDVPRDIKPKKLKILALNAGGFTKEARDLQGK